MTITGSTEATQPETAVEEKERAWAMNANEAAVRNAYQVAERKDLAGWVNCFTEDGTFTDESIGVTYRGKQLSEPVEIYAAAFPDMHRELYRFFVDGDTVIVELATEIATGDHTADGQTDGRAVLRRVSLEKRQDSILQLLPLGNGDLRAARSADQPRSPPSSLSI
jgi:ketosteroid isomerase-like protein